MMILCFLSVDVLINHGICVLLAEKLKCTTSSIKIFFVSRSVNFILPLVYILYKGRYSFQVIGYVVSDIWMISLNIVSQRLRSGQVPYM